MRLFVIKLFLTTTPPPWVAVPKRKRSARHKRLRLGRKLVPIQSAKGSQSRSYLSTLIRVRNLIRHALFTLHSDPLPLCSGPLLVSGPAFSLSLHNVISYFAGMRVSTHELFSLFGFFTFLTLGLQLLSGVMLSFSLIPESMLIAIVREEEDLEDLYIDDFFWMHERGVDLIFIFSYIHLFRKLYLGVFDSETEASWKSGVILFLLFQVVVFFGLVLCCTHLSEITLTIAANVLHTFFDFKGKAYWWFFTDKQLNTDTMVRLAYAHYLSAFYMVFMGVVHGVDIHYDWKNEAFYDGLAVEMVWWDEALSNELGLYVFVLLVISACFFFLYEDPEALSYEIFMWGDVGMVTDVRFYGVAPHWYFRPFMAWLIACPFHKIGVFGLLFLFVSLYFQPNLHGESEQSGNGINSLSFIGPTADTLALPMAVNSSLESNMYHQTTYSFFIMCALYTTSFLPYGRFFQRVGGNWGFLWAYFFVFAYLGFSWLRKPLMLNLAAEYLHDTLYQLRGDPEEELEEDEIYDW